MVLSSFHLFFRSSQFISFCVSFLSRVNELNKLACSPCMGTHSSASRALQRERRGHGFESRWSPKAFFWANSHFQYTFKLHVQIFFNLNFMERTKLVIQYIYISRPRWGWGWRGCTSTLWPRPEISPQGFNSRCYECSHRTHKTSSWILEEKFQGIPPRTENIYIYIYISVNLI